MKFCTNCGNKLEEGSLQCAKCGKSFDNTASTNVELSDVNSDNTLSQLPSFFTSLSKNSKLRIGIGCIVVILLLIFFKVGSTFTSKERLIENFKNAVVNKNEVELSKYIKSPNPALKINSSNSKILLEYLNNNQSYFNKLAKSLETQSKVIDENTSSFLPSKYILNLKKQGKTMLFFNKYSLEVVPFYITVSTNCKDTAILLNNTLLCTTNTDNFSKNFGPFMPGTYKIKASYRGEYAALGANTDINLISNVNSLDKMNTTIAVNLNLSGNYISPYSNFENAKLYANYRDTGLTIKDAKRFGPVDSSVKIYAQIAFPWGTISSKELPAVGNCYLEINAINDLVSNDIMNAINDYNRSDVVASMLRDASKYVNVTDKEKLKLTKKIDEMKNNKRLYTGKYTKAIFDLESIKIYVDNNDYKATIRVKEYYDDVFYNEGQTPPSTTVKDVTWEYTLIYNDKRRNWLVDESSRTYYFIPTSTKEFNFN